MPGPEDQFEEMAEEVSVMAGTIDCSKAEYLDGLQTLIDRLATDQLAARETLEDEEPE